MKTAVLRVVLRIGTQGGEEGMGPGERRRGLFPDSRSKMFVLNTWNSLASFN